MLNHDASPPDPPSPNVAAALIRQRIINEGVGNHVDEVRAADVDGREEDAMQLLRDLDGAMEHLGVPLRDWVGD